MMHVQTHELFIATSLKWKVLLLKQHNLGKFERVTVHLRWTVKEIVIFIRDFVAVQCLFECLPLLCSNRPIRKVVTSFYVVEAVKSLSLSDVKFNCKNKSNNVLPKLQVQVQFHVQCSDIHMLARVCVSAFRLLESCSIQQWHLAHAIEWISILCSISVYSYPCQITQYWWWSSAEL